MGAPGALLDLGSHLAGCLFVNLTVPFVFVQARIGVFQTQFGVQGLPQFVGQSKGGHLRYYNRRVPETRWYQYVQAVSGNAQAIEIAKRVDIDNSAITRWKQGQQPTIGFVIAFARAYRRNVLEAFVAAEFITDDEANLREVNVGPESLTNDQLVEEVRRRLGGGRGDGE